ncbi:MAG: DUF4307 domain-containing protein [Kineosporiaceae bacterium]
MTTGAPSGTERGWEPDVEEPEGPGARATLGLWWRRRPRSVVAALVGLTCGVAWAAWMAVRLGDPDVTWQVYGYRVVSESSTRVTLLVSRDPGTPEAVCRVRALDASFGEVGSLEVRVPPATTRTVRLTVDVPTTRLAVTGTVEDCVVPQR